MEGSYQEAVSEDEEFVVHKKKWNRSASRRLSASDDDLPSDLLAKSCKQSHCAETVEKKKTYSFNEESSESGNSDNDQDEDLAANETVVRKKIIIRALSDSDDDQPNSGNFASSETTEKQNNLEDCSSSSEDDLKVKSTRVRKRDKMVEKIKKRFNKTKTQDENLVTNSKVMKPLVSLCDNDSSMDSDNEPSTSTEESDLKHLGHFQTESMKSMHVSLQKNERKPKHTKERPKCKQMTAKQAMENMTKIKSESNRMLRESRVLLPYHRPKQVTLKDILSRKKLDFPLRMNQDQLKQFASQLEENEKKIEELYKSDDEDEDESEIGSESKTFEESEKKDIEHKEITDGVSNECMETNRKASDDNFERRIDCNSTARTELCNDFSVTINSDIEKDDKLESTKLTNSHFDHKNVDSQLIMLHLDSEDTEIDKYQSDNASKYHAFQETVNEVILETNGTPEETNHQNTKADLNICKSAENCVDVDVDDDYSNLPSIYSEIIPKTVNEQNNEEVISSLTANDSINCEGKKNLKEVISEAAQDCAFDDDFPDDEADICHIEALMDKIENGKGMEDTSIPTKFVKNANPCLSGTPGMTIDLDAPVASVKMSGLEIFKQQYINFSKKRTAEEEEIYKEKKMKPGTKRFLLKQELMKQIAEQSIAEWTKRIENEKQQQLETKGDLSDCEEELEKMEKDCNQEINDVTHDVEGIREEKGDEVERVYDLEDELESRHAKATKIKPNPLIDDEAEVEDGEFSEEEHSENQEDENAEDEDETDSEDEESSSEEENYTTERKTKKGRIIKAFDDSDDEEQNKVTEVVSLKEKYTEKGLDTPIRKCTPDLFASQATDADEEISLAQPNRSNSEDMNISFCEEPALKKTDISKTHPLTTEKLSVLFETQPTSNTQVDMEAIVGMCSGKFTSEAKPHLPRVPAYISGPAGGAATSTPVIGEDILQLCSGKFDEHLLATQTMDSETLAKTMDAQAEPSACSPAITEENRAQRLFDEVDDCDVPSTNKFFGPHVNGQANTIFHVDGTENKLVQRGKLVIESSDEETEFKIKTKKRKLKRKKADKRALVISDDEEEEPSDVEGERSGLEDDELAPEDDELALEGDRLVEYDSEENEVEVPQAAPHERRRRAVHEFMEREAELSSEEEWVGSGDEDERGLDRLEREEGDDDVFHQGRLQRELGQMHAQELMAQDRHEVRLLQEILLEDGDLAGGGRQRTFRWKNSGGGEELGTAPDEFGDTPEEERESEEQWRRQRHERQLFLKQLAAEQKTDDDDILGLGTATSTSLATSVWRQTVSVVQHGDDEKSGAAEKCQSSAKDVPSPRKDAFTLMQQQYRTLVCGGGAGDSLRRLAAALAPAEQLPAGKSARPGQRSFVFATRPHPAAASQAQDQEDNAGKKTKRKAVVAAGTPKLIKKMRLEEQPKNSFFQQLDT